MLPFSRAILVATLGVSTACDRGAAGDSPPADAGAAPVPPAGEWVTVLERGMRGKQSTPEPFRTTSDALRVITTLGSPSSPYAPGLVITNLLSDSTALPVASIRAEQRRVEGATADTTVVEVPPGRLYFFVAEHRGLEDWGVSIQEFRPAPG
jgi:hypothetical protein